MNAPVVARPYLVEDSERGINEATASIPFGIDKLDMTVPVEDHLLPYGPKGGLKTRMAVSRGVRCLAIETNPSRLLRPRSTWLCPSEGLGAALERALEILPYSSEELDLRRLWDGEVTRLDVARDFVEVAYLPAWLESMRREAGRHGAGSEMFENDWEIGVGPNGLRFGRDCQVKVYDKHRLRPVYASPGEVRFEVQARSRWLRKVGISRVADVRLEACQTLLVEKWRGAGFDKAVIRTEDFILRVLQRTDWPLQVRGRFLADSFVQAYDLELGGSYAHRKRFAQRQREVGRPGPLVEVGSVRLDLERGIEVRGE